jgi:hypothetical protein
VAHNRQKILAEALGLPSEDRAAIAGALLRSLDVESDEDPDAVADAWAEEIRRRVAALDSGEAELLSPEEARRLITGDAEDR